jgi:hypothetical protein
MVQYDLSDSQTVEPKDLQNPFFLVPAPVPVFENGFISKIEQNYSIDCRIADNDGCCLMVCHAAHYNNK